MYVLGVGIKVGVVRVGSVVCSTSIFTVIGLPDRIPCVVCMHGGRFLLGTPKCLHVEPPNYLYSKQCCFHFLDITARKKVSW